MENITLEYLWQKGYELITDFGWKFIAALAILLFGKLIIKYICRAVRKVMESRKVDPAVVSFTSSLTHGTLWAFVVIAALARLGVQTTSFIAVLGAAGLAIGLALQGSLSNFAAGFLIIIFKPFKVGDLIDTGGTVGIIDSINIFTTVLRTTDNRIIIIPNSQITSGTIINITAADKRRVDFTFSVAHDADIQQVKDVLLGVITHHNLVLTDPPPFLRISNLTNSSIEFTVRVWGKTEDYWTIFYDIIEQVKIEFNRNKIGMPFPQYVINSRSSINA